MKVLPWRAEIEYRHHSYFSWGWDKQENYSGNIVPMPSPLLARFKNKHNQKKAVLLMVGTAAYPYLFRLSSGQHAVQIMKYRKEKVSFIRNLDIDVFRALLYRPYLNEAAVLNDLSYIENKFPGIAICSSNFHKEMLNCKLLILDHPGTTLCIAMAANVPTICFWDKNHWVMSKQAKPYFEAMKEVGMFFESGKSAADKVNEIWNDVKSWWSISDIQKARKDFCEKQANTSKYWRFKWAKELWKL